jgi:GNAT superfamily N-acetyltransferase
MAGEFFVRSIREDEIGQFASILKEAAEWLRQQGREMWIPEQLTAERLLEQNAMHEMYIGFVNGEPAATMIIQETDPVMWPEESTRPDSLYLHKLSVRRAYAKTGCSAMMIGWAKEEVKRRDKTFLRLDCAADRPKLCSFYEKHGFCKVRERLIRQKYPIALYEWNEENKTSE